MKVRKWAMSIVIVLALFSAQHVAAQQSAAGLPDECTTCIPCGLRGLYTQDLAASPYAILYLDQPTCWDGYRCADAIPCPAGSGEELDLLLAKGTAADLNAYEKKYPGSVELVPSRGVVLVRDQCTKQVAVVLPLGKVRMAALNRTIAALP